MCMVPVYKMFKAELLASGDLIYDFKENHLVHLTCFSPPLFVKKEINKPDNDWLDGVVNE